MRNLLALGLLSIWLCASVSVGESRTEFRLLERTFPYCLSWKPRRRFQRRGQARRCHRLSPARGANCVRLRLFVNPNGQAGVVNDLPYTIALAQRVKAAGMQLYLALHYRIPGRMCAPN